jgi:hypothetical protein
MAKKTKVGTDIAAGVRGVLDTAKKASAAALEKGYAPESRLTKRYYAGVGKLGKYGDQEAQQALNRSGRLYEKYGEAGKYDKTGFGDIGAMYGRAGEYDPSEFTMADYTTRNIKERMSPYEELVAEQAQRRLKRAYDEGRGEREAQAARAGAFGGSGAAVQEEVARRNYMEQLAQQNAQSLQAAYESAVNLYGKEVADRLSAEELGEASRQFSKQTELAGIEGIMAARQQTAAQVAAAKEAEFAGLQGQGASAAQQASLAEARKRMEAANLGALQEAGAQQQQQQLAENMYGLDVAQRGANILAGTQGSAAPVASYKPEEPSTLQKIAGAGAAVIGAAAGLGLRDGGIVSMQGYNNGGYVYRGGGLADLQPQYYSKYER